MGTDTLSMPIQVVALPTDLVASSAGDLRAVLHEAVDRGTGPLVVDLDGVDRVDVVGLGVLVGAHRRAEARGRTLRIARPSRRVAAVLHVTGLERVLCPRRGRTGNS